MSAADQTKLAALTPKTTSGLVATSSRPPRAGPANAPTPSSVLDATFAAVSSAGVRASTGSNAACAGRNGVPAAVDTPTIAYTSHAAPSNAITAAAAPIRPAHIRSEPAITIRLGIRSASVARNEKGPRPGSCGSRRRSRQRSHHPARRRTRRARPSTTTSRGSRPPRPAATSSVRDSGTSRRAACLPRRVVLGGPARGELPTLVVNRVPTREDFSPYRRLVVECGACREGIGNLEGGRDVRRA